MTDVLRRKGRDNKGISAKQEDNVKKEQERAHLQTKERNLRRKQACCHLDLERLASRAVKKQFFVG